jgi:3-oxoacyl-[acyl-carrier-protein] synthase-3
MPFATIQGVGFHVPSRRVTNDELTQIWETSDDWIFERSGIRARHWVDGTGVAAGPADLAVPAVGQALAQAGISKDDVDMIVFATLSPEAYFPGSGCFLQEKLGLERNIPALDVRMQCSGFIYALSVAEMYIKQGMYKHILVVGGEVQSTGLDHGPEGRTIGVLFGDGAGAVVVSASDGPRGILSTHLHTQGKNARELWQEEPSSIARPKFKEPSAVGNFPYMNGREVFRHAITRMSEVIQEALDHNGWKMEDVDLVVPHQANHRISLGVASHMGIPESKVFSNIEHYGNTTAATIPICFTEAEQQGRLKRGDKVIAVAFGSGFTWASAAIIW